MANRLTGLLLDDQGSSVHYIYGNAGNNILNGTSGQDFIWGYGGHDVIHGRQGDDFIFGGNGDDKLYGDKGDDALWGDRGNDLLEGGEGHDRLYAGEGNDTLKGGAGNDLMLGDAGKDVLTGGDGDDDLDGGAGADKLYGGNGNDTLHYTGYQDLYDGGAGIDRLDMAPDLAQPLPVSDRKDSMEQGVAYDLVVDMSLVDARNMDFLDLGNQGYAVSVSISTQDILKILDPASNTLYVEGGQEDHVNLENGFRFVDQISDMGSHAFNIYEAAVQGGKVFAYVDASVNVTLIPPAPQDIV